MLSLSRQLRTSGRLLSTWADTFDKYLMGAEPVVKDKHSKLLAKRGLIYNVQSKTISFHLSLRYLFLPVALYSLLFHSVSDLGAITTINV